jgi:hypothetical protein
MIVTTTRLDTIVDAIDDYCVHGQITFVNRLAEQIELAIRQRELKLAQEAVDRFQGTAW